MSTEGTRPPLRSASICLSLLVGLWGLQFFVRFENSAGRCWKFEFRIAKPWRHIFLLFISPSRMQMCVSVIISLSRRRVWCLVERVGFQATFSRAWSRTAASPASNSAEVNCFVLFTHRVLLLLEEKNWNAIKLNSQSKRGTKIK
jgi:hypothetical protein